MFFYLEDNWKFLLDEFNVQPIHLVRLSSFSQSSRHLNVGVEYLLCTFGSLNNKCNITIPNINNFFKNVIIIN